MVGRLMQLVQYSYKSFALSGSRKDGQTELIFAHGLRTTERKEQSAGLYFFKSHCVQSRIALQRIVDGTAMFGKGRRVKHDEIVTPVHI